MLAGPRGTQIAEVEISLVPATKIAALRDSEGSGSTKASEEKAAANQRLSESTQLISEAERPVIS